MGKKVAGKAKPTVASASANGGKGEGMTKMKKKDVPQKPEHLPETIKEEEEEVEAEEEEEEESSSASSEDEDMDRSRRRPNTEATALRPYRNRQRVLVFASVGITKRGRFLMTGLRSLLPPPQKEKQPQQRTQRHT